MDGHKGGMVRIYIDTCCWGRAWDGKDQASIVAEADAIAKIIDWRYINGHTIIGSPILKSEILKNPKIKDRDAIMSYFKDTISEYVYLTAAAKARARVFEAAGLKRNDSLHLAAAERAGVDILLTADKTFLRICNSKNLCGVKAMNPLNFI